MEKLDVEKIREQIRHWVAFIGVRRIATSCVSVFLLAGIAWFIFKPTPVPIDASLPQISSVVSSVPTTASVQDVKVHVAGAVQSPGVYQLKSSARVVDAIAAAGGALRSADLESINLAQTIVDTEQVYVPLKRVSRPRITVAPRLKPHRNNGTTTPGSNAIPGASVPSSTTLVNLNTATAAQLDSLTGVGPSTAKAIIAYRTKKGSFTKVEDLLNVPGIGPAKLAAMRDEVTIG